MTARHNAAQHYRAAEDFADRAAKAAGHDDPTTDRLTALGRLHLDLAVHADQVLLGHDGRRDPDYLEPGAGWPPSRGDIWRDREGRHWAVERERMACLSVAIEGIPTLVADEHGPMQLVFRPYVPSAFDDECPF